MRVHNDGKVAVNLPNDFEEAMEQYRTDPVTHSMIKLQSTRDGRSPKRLISLSLGNTLRVDPDRIGMVEAKR